MSGTNVNELRALAQSHHFQKFVILTQPQTLCCSLSRVSGIDVNELRALAQAPRGSRKSEAELQQHHRSMQVRRRPMPSVL